MLRRIDRGARSVDRTLTWRTMKFPNFLWRRTDSAVCCISGHVSHGSQSVVDIHLEASIELAKRGEMKGKGEKEGVLFRLADEGVSEGWFEDAGVSLCMSSQ